MKRPPILVVFLCLALLVTGSAAEPVTARQQEEQQLVTLAKELQAQQVAIGENQTKIEAKLAAIAEAVRVARIFSSRGGR